MMSTNGGINWETASRIPDGFYQADGVAWNGSLWVAVGESLAYYYPILWSTDGKNWYEQEGSDKKFFGRRGVGVAWNGSLWVSAGANNGGYQTIAYSTDGKNWSYGTGACYYPGGHGDGYGVAWNGSVWVALETISKIMWSYDGKVWNNATGETFTQVSSSGAGVASNGSMFVAVGNNSSNSKNSLLYSYNGMLWYNTGTDNFPLGRGYMVASNGTMWVAFGTGTNWALYSTDGITWQASGSARLITGEKGSVAWDGSKWLAVGYNYGTITIIESYNGKNWGIPTNSNLFGNNGQGFSIAYGKYAPSYHSTNGIDWTAESVTLPNRDTNLNKIINKNKSNRYLLINRDIYDFSNNIYIDASDIEQPILPNVDNSLSFVGTNNLGFELSKNTDTNVNYTIRINNSALVDWSYCKVEYYNA
jgi:hypothetical protein